MEEILKIIDKYLNDNLTESRNPISILNDIKKDIAKLENQTSLKNCFDNIKKDFDNFCKDTDNILTKGR